MGRGGESEPFAIVIILRRRLNAEILNLAGELHCSLALLLLSPKGKRSIKTAAHFTRHATLARLSSVISHSLPLFVVCCSLFCLPRSHLIGLAGSSSSETKFIRFRTRCVSARLHHHIPYLPYLCEILAKFYNKWNV